MKEDLFIFGPVEEFHAFQKFNAFLYKIKKYFNKITAIVFERAIGIISEADELLVISNEYLNSKNANYPEILNILGNRNVSQSYEIIFNKIKEQNPNAKILFYDHLLIKDIEDTVFFPWYTAANLIETFNRDIELIRIWLRDGNLLYPTKNSLEKLKTEYNNLVDKNTFIFITRDFQNKQPELNTKIGYPQTENFIQFLVNKGHNVVNIGYPPSRYSITTNDNTGKYNEIFPMFNQDVLFALFSKSKGVFSFTSGLFINSCAYSNIFKLQIEFYQEWSPGETFIDIKKQFKDIQSLDFIQEYQNLNFDLIYDMVKNIKPPKKIKTAKNQEIKFIL
jgi:hypothetical protein